MLQTEEIFLWTHWHSQQQMSGFVAVLLFGFNLCLKEDFDLWDSNYCTSVYMWMNK